MMIPKIIHYCWFGRGKLPKSAQRCIASWRKYLPDYEIRQWNEDNFDVNIVPYTAQAYAARKWAFVSDYARMWVLYHHGGLYFDTDVEVVAPIDDILANGAYFGAEAITDNGLRINPGLGMAAEKGNKILADVLEMYHSHERGKQFEIGNIVTFTTNVLRAYGLKNVLEIQTIGNYTIYPPDYFNPLDASTGKLNTTSNTRSIHWFDASWMSLRNRITLRSKTIIRRLFGV